MPKATHLPSGDQAGVAAAEREQQRRHAAHQPGPVVTCLAAEERAERPGPQADDLRDATTFLQDPLAGGPRLTKDVEDEGHQAHGLTRRTLQRARKTLGIESFREQVPGPWWLRLPSNTAKAAKEEELGALGTVAKTAEF